MKCDASPSPLGWHLCCTVQVHSSQHRSVDRGRMKNDELQRPPNSDDISICLLPSSCALAEFQSIGSFKRQATSRLKSSTSTKEGPSILRHIRKERPISEGTKHPEQRGADSQRGGAPPLVSLNGELSRWSRWSDLSVMPRDTRSRMSPKDGAGPAGASTLRAAEPKRKCHRGSTLQQEGNHGPGSSKPRARKRGEGAFNTRADFQYRAEGSTEASQVPTFSSNFSGPQHGSSVKQSIR